MFKSFFTGILFCLVMYIEGSSQSSIQPVISKYSYNPPSAEKNSWQRLNVMLGATYYRVVKEIEKKHVGQLLLSGTLGLLLNEAITNSIKYAFPDNKNGEITICRRTCPAAQKSDSNSTFIL